jgi:hypothetical protein
MEPDSGRLDVGSLHQTGPGEWWYWLHVASSVGAFLTFGCIVFAGGHGIGPVFILYLPLEGNIADVYTCLVWGSAWLVAASHVMTNCMIAVVGRVLAFGLLCFVGIQQAIESKVFEDQECLLLASMTSAPFIGLVMLELSLDFRSAWKASHAPRNYRFSIRDLLLLVVAAVGFVLPVAIF